MGNLVRTSIIVPAFSLTQEQRYQVHEQALWMAVDMAQKDQAIHEYHYTARSLTGLDFALTNMGWSETVTATAGTTVATYELSAINVSGNNAARRDRVIVVYGVMLGSSVDSVTSVRWIIGGARTHEWQFGSVFAADPYIQSALDRTLYVYPPGPPGWIDPVQIPTGASVAVEVYVRGGTAVGIQAANLMFQGIVVEPIGGGGSGLSLGG